MDHSGLPVFDGTIELDLAGKDGRKKISEMDDRLMNDITQLNNYIAEAYPGATLNLTPPLRTEGFWWLDIKQNQRELSIRWAATLTSRHIVGQVRMLGYGALWTPAFLRRNLPVASDPVRPCWRLQ